MAVNGIESHFRIDQRHSTYKKSTSQETKDNVLDRDFNADTPEQYPVAPNRKIERFWEKIEKNKAKQQERAQQ